MAVHDTNMRLKLPILAIAWEILIIILYALFVVYDDGSSEHGHSSSSNHTEQSNVSLYPSEYPRVSGRWGVENGGGLPFRLQS